MITWSRLLIDDHCSSWSIVQLLGWLNHSRVAWLKTKRAWRFHLRGQPVLLPDAGAGTYLAEQEELSDVACLLAEPRRWLPEAGLRYCPACIGYGMHYAHQQDHRFRNCIIHGLPLREHCRSCGNALETKGVSCNGYVCRRCGESLLHLNVPRLRESSQIESVTAALDELERWQSAADQLNTGCQRPGTGRAIPLWGGLSLSSAGAYWRAIALNPNPRVADALEPAPVSFRTVPTVARLNPIQPSLNSLSAEDTVHRYRLLFMHVSRHHRRRHLRGHGTCARYAIAAMGGVGHRIASDIYIQPDMCCLGQAYALWKVQWERELRRMEVRMERLITSDEHTDTPLGLPSLGAAQLSFVSSFQHWVDALAEIQSAYTGSDQLAMLDGVTEAPHWALLQKGTELTCPIHFRHPALTTLGHCDRGEVRRRARTRIDEILTSIGHARSAPRKGLEQ